jgi:hypothetical protein
MTNDSSDVKTVAQESMDAKKARQTIYPNKPLAGHAHVE